VSAPPVTLDLAGVRDALLALPHPFRREDVHRVASRLRVRPADLERWQHWSDEQYTRTRFYHGERFEILVLCWNEGQESPIHDHARSICTMTVLEGEAATTMYRIDEAAGRKALVREATTTLPEGSVTTVYGGDIHRVGNPRGSGRRLITIHIYLPPIPEMLVWEEGDPTPHVRAAATLEPRD
jgi:cysteine dioxygenase